MPNKVTITKADRVAANEIEIFIICISQGRWTPKQISSIIATAMQPERDAFRMAREAVIFTLKACCDDDASSLPEAIDRLQDALTAINGVLDDAANK